MSHPPLDGPMRRLPPDARQKQVASSTRPREHVDQEEVFLGDFKT